MKLPKIALGAWAWGNDGFFGDEYTLNDLRPVFDRSQELGLNLWDTAYVYGMGTSEKILGQLIKSSQRNNVILSTKFTPFIAGDSENPVEEMLSGSLTRLGTEQLEIYWIHNSDDVEKWTPFLIPLLKSGKIKNVGVSNHNLEQIKLAESILAKEGFHISAVQNHYSLLYRSSEEAGIIEYCNKNGIDFFAYMILEQGALAGKYGVSNPFPEGSERAKVYNPMLSEIDNIVSVVKKIGETHNASVAQILMAWAIFKGTLPIVGVTKSEQVEEVAQAINISLSEEEVGRMEDAANRIDVTTLRSWEKDMNQ